MKTNTIPSTAQETPIELSHFPTRFQAVIWRNSSLVTPRRLAKLLKTTEPTIVAEAKKLGLTCFADENVECLWLRRGYVTLIRQNWHLLPYEQLLGLLNFTSEQLEYTLKEDDFLWNKLGGFKPTTRPVEWNPLTPRQERATREIKTLIQSSCGEFQSPSNVRPFDFLDDYGEKLPQKVPNPSLDSAFGLRLAYSHSAVYGDPLSKPELDPYPEGLLDQLAANGVNAIWLHCVLYTLVPWFGDAALSAGGEKRVRNLNKLVDKAARRGIDVYLYLNEPRGMRPDFFDTRPNWKGAFQQATNLNAMCLSNPEILTKLKAGVSRLFQLAPKLKGVFTITMSENLTHCHSKPCQTACPRCAERNTGDLVAAVNNAIADGAWSAKTNADVIVWSWGWAQEWRKRAIDQLRSGVKIMCVSESHLPTETAGVKGFVGDYSMSKVGPGPVADETWALATERGLETLAKIQINNTWECSAVPYLPVPFLVKKHIENLRKRNISGLMISWTLGGFPGGNMRLIDEEPEDLALEWFGEAAAPGVLDAWRTFGDAFAEFPLHATGCLYRGPQNYGPMNLLHEKPTNRTATMIGFPYDDLKNWRGDHFPEDVFEDQFQKISENWKRGLDHLKATAPLVATSPERRSRMNDLLTVSEAVHCHFRSSFLQIRFIRLRDGETTNNALDEITTVLREEIDLAKRLIEIIRRDSRIGFEASNHYYYTENALMEKILNCERIMKHLRGEIRNETAPAIDGI